eukprot:TRINITY_DN3327_c0_g1_i1.p1 TRINITY_DN3327_c0_g1~~TRINITY_DN3327_c0_g1_i1.p1  ORF type:complete len:177 (+),score=10.53 TRINITY_DN3327_c0_g1_i1:56-586(+)
MRLDIKRELLARSDRVKALDLHPTEPWVLTALYSGQVQVWNITTGAAVLTLDASDLPTRCARFVPRQQWIITGSDDLHVRVFHHATHERVKAFEAHTDYIRCIAPHETQPWLLTSADDLQVRLWDWERGWQNLMVRGCYVDRDKGELWWLGIAWGLGLFGGLVAETHGAWLLCGSR